MVDSGLPENASTIVVELNAVDMRLFTVMDSVSIQDTQGQPVTAHFTLVNPFTSPVVGDAIRILYYAQVIFSGTIDRINKSSSDLKNRLYEIDCLDWAQTLFRRKISRTFTSQSVLQIVNSILSTELVNERVTLGVIETTSVVPLVETKNARIFDVLRDLAATTGQTFYVDFDQKIEMRSVTVTASPLVFSEGNVLLDGTTVDMDRDTYRNTQTSLVTGTPAAGVAANTYAYTESNLDQIAARKAIEGGTGIYEEIQEITHPTSNDSTQLGQLAIGYAVVSLILSGTPRQTIKCPVRGYGFRSGQIATVSLPTFGIVGTYIIQRVTGREQSGQYLFHELELTSSNAQQRAYESWLAIVKGAKVTVKIPGAITTNLATFSTPGATTWTVPGGVTEAQFICFGGSGGAGGYWKTVNKHGSVTPGDWTCDRAANGGAGGNGAKVISIRTVVAGQIYNVVVGAKGAKATQQIGSIDSLAVCGNNTNNSGSAGTASTVKLGTVTMAQADGGAGGNKADGTSTTGVEGADGSPGSGFGDLIGVGGGKIGGANWPVSDGQDGTVLVRW
jgi:hypothetical protein